MMDEKQYRIDSYIETGVQDIINQCDEETDRETAIELLDEACDDAWGHLVQYGRIDEYDVDDLVTTASDCAEIIKYAQENAWVENDYGLWEGLTYGVLASIAYFSLRNCFYQALADAGYDSNDEFPFAA